jgi:hypothetical protein
MLAAKAQWNMVAERVVHWCIIASPSRSNARFVTELESMPPLRFPVAVIMQRIPLANRWASERWEAVAIEAGDDSAPECTLLSDGPEGTRWRCTGQLLELHPTEAEGHYLNVSAREPKVFVLWRMAEPGDTVEPRARPLIVTVSYSEAARFLDAGEQVDAVPMPAAILAALQAFVAAHYRPEPRKKAKRNELYEEAEARRRENDAGPNQ